MKIQIILQVYRGHMLPEAPEGFRREQNGICWEYFGESTNWETARAVGRQLSEQEGISDVEVYNVAMWKESKENK